MQIEGKKIYYILDKANLKNFYSRGIILNIINYLLINF